MAQSTEATTGRVDAEGNVYVVLPSGVEHRAGQWAAGDPSAGLAFFHRRFLDLSTEVDLAARRLTEAKTTADSAAATSAKVRHALVEPSCVGDLADLFARLDALDALVHERRGAAAAERRAAKAAVLAARIAIVEEAERLVGSTAWRETTERFKELLGEWQTKPHGDRSTEQELWKRFSQARSGFDRARRTHFTALEATRSQARAAKTELVHRAEELSDSTDWAATAIAYRALMTEWKAAPRGNRTDEDKYWTAFRAAQEKFFAARTSALDERDSGLRENLAAKEVLAAAATALLPITNLETAKSALRQLQAKWEKLGHVPRGDKDRVEAPFRRVEEALRDFEKDRWRRSNPETGARARATVDLFRTSVAKLEFALATARGTGDEQAIARAEADLQAQQGLLEAAMRAAAEFSI